MRIMDGKHGKQKPLTAVEDLLARSGIDPDDVASVDKLKIYQGFALVDGEPVVVDLASATVRPAMMDTPESQYLRQAPEVRIVRPLRAAKPSRDGTRTVMVLPDPQIGWRRQHDGRLIPTHDTAAIDVAMRVLRWLRPEMVVNLGDTLDFSEMSVKYPTSPEDQYVSQLAIDSASEFFSQQRANAGPDARIVAIEGNHDRRIEILLEKVARQLQRLARAGESTPVMSIPYLLRLDELGVEYVGGFPAGRVEIAPGNGTTHLPLVAVHGTSLTSKKHAEQHGTSIVHGHTHRIDDYRNTMDVGGLPQTQIAWSPGCLCRIDGAVPSVRGSTDLGSHVHSIEQWQQGLGLVTVQPDGSWTHETYQIVAGSVTVRGKTFSASPDAQEALDGSMTD